MLRGVEHDRAVRVESKQSKMLLHPTIYESIQEKA
jgi:hypothetical protein